MDTNDGLTFDGEASFEAYALEVEQGFMQKKKTPNEELQDRIEAPFEALHGLRKAAGSYAVGMKAVKDALYEMDRVVITLKMCADLTPADLEKLDRVQKRILKIRFNLNGADAETFGAMEVPKYIEETWRILSDRRR